MADIFQWVATGATVLAALVTASNLGARITGYGFCIFLIGSLSWIVAGTMTGQSALVWNNALLTLLNIFGIWRWLGRQAKVEEGGQEAARSSRAAPGEDLLPVSRLVSAKVARAGKDIGHCVDAMAGCASGSVRYLVFTDDGVAGVGETLRRVDWKDVAVDGEAIELRTDPARLQTVERDAWPGR